jgi:hypothetical protein
MLGQSLHFPKEQKKLGWAMQAEEYPRAYRDKRLLLEFANELFLKCLRALGRRLRVGDQRNVLLIVLGHLEPAGIPAHNQVGQQVRKGAQEMTLARHMRDATPRSWQYL